MLVEVGVYSLGHRATDEDPGVVSREEQQVPRPLVSILSHLTSSSSQIMYCPRLLRLDEPKPAELQ